MISMFLLAGAARPVYASNAFVTSNTAASTASPVSITAISVNAGNTVIAIAGATGGSVVFSDSETDTPTLVNTEVDSGLTVFEQMSYFTVATTSTTYTVTATYSGGSTRNTLVVLVYSGVTSIGNNAVSTGS
ncbi:MAG TPA: hypothetical protein VE177_03530, partial [Candidatus Binatus sp.]|nr:hypothetical protein [Candidatus Binatus sp.]